MIPGIIAGVIKPAASDPHWANVVSLMHFDSDFSDVREKSWTGVSSPTISNSVFRFGGGSGFFNGGPYIQTGSSSDFAFGTGDFTVEGWIYATVMPTGFFFCPFGNWASNAGGCFFLKPNGVIGWHSNTTVVNSPNSTISTNTWYHIAYSRQSGTGRLFVNGAQVASGSDVANITSTSGWRVGNNRTSTDFWRGYVDEMRITKGVARYDGNFTVPTGPYPDGP